ncbi:MAG: hypothetical protein OXI90_17355 [Gammaproteobacteria bacterium]|nr:hypothetical protein [Gammaproteobacteria bacterium]
MSVAFDGRDRGASSHLRVATIGKVPDKPVNGSEEHDAVDLWNVVGECESGTRVGRFARQRTVAVRV